MPGSTWTIDPGSMREFIAGIGLEGDAGSGTHVVHRLHGVAQHNGGSSRPQIDGVHRPQRGTGTGPYHCPGDSTDVDDRHFWVRVTRFEYAYRPQIG